MTSDPLGRFDTSKPNIARAYDFLLGGKDNFAADRELAARILQVYPLTAVLVRDNRAFLARAVDYVSRQGVSQFIDVGSGLPTSPNTHEVARAVDPEARVLYVDNDPVVLTHASALLTVKGKVTAASGDARQPEAILATAEQLGIIDLRKPVCVIITMLLHFIDPAAAAELTAAFVRGIAPGSFMIISLGVNNDAPDMGERFQTTYTAGDVYPHDRKQIEGYFAGLDIVEPGLTEARFWRPAAPPDTTARLGDVITGVGRKR